MVFPHFGCGSKGTKGLFSSWIGSCVIFRNISAESRQAGGEGEEGQSPLATGAGSRSSEASGAGGVLRREGEAPGLGLRRPQLVHQEGVLRAAALPPEPSSRGSEVLFPM